FDEVLSLVGPSLAKKSNREPINPAQRLALTLRFLSQGDSLFSLASGYKVVRSTVSLIIKETTETLWNILNGLVLKPLTLEDFQKIAEQFEGAIDGKHIAIQCPPNSGSEFFNYKKHFSIVLLVICDAHYNFRYVNVGVYGSQSDGGVLSNSAFLDTLDKLQLPEECYLPNSTIRMPYFIVGDDSFPLSKYLMKPYKGTSLPLKKQIFDYRLSRARRVIENSFGILVARWRIFTRTISSRPETVDFIIKATVCLHNFIKKKEYHMSEVKRKYCPQNFFDRETDNGVVEGDWRREVGKCVVLEDVHRGRNCGNNPGKSALTIRENLTEYLISPAGSLPGQVDYVKRGRSNI
ncbi:protein ALP1-like, partial [Coccinella septempunctata]|uniref:protein ALP1-like n=1 Tax=Coccinella septempunctata TaxID=41139 RepID=UPI001D08911E